MHQNAARAAERVPPHCPNPDCPYHKHLRGPWPYRKKGFYRSASRKQPIQRYQCRDCRRLFSDQTFSVTYWLKRPDLLARIPWMLVGCMGDRQIARALGCSQETVSRLRGRLGRHCMLFQMRMWALAPPRGPLAIDGFESFEYSQFHPCHFNLAVEAQTGFVPFFTDSELRRKGRMTARQKRKRAELEEMHGRPSPREIRHGIRELLEVALSRKKKAVVLSDEHKAYPPALRQVDCQITHLVTNSKKPRTFQNPLFPVNELDLLIRHSQSNHKRETIAFSKRRNSAAEKLAILVVWRNWVKKRFEKGEKVTAAMLKGLTDRIWGWEEILEKRLFPGRIPLPDRWQRYYRREIVTRASASNRVHDLAYAF